MLRAPRSLRPPLQVVNSETGTKRRLVTDSDGRYAAPSIAVGTYSVTASGAGYGTQQRTGVTVVVGQSALVDMVLTIGKVTQEVVVQASGETVNVTTQQTSGLVNERQVKDLP